MVDPSCVALKCSGLRRPAPLLYRNLFQTLRLMNERIDPGTPSSSTVLESHIDPTSARFEANMRFLADLVSQVRNEEEKIREGGGPKRSRASTTKDG